MVVARDESLNSILDHLGVNSFKERLPWFGGDLQTLRDTFVDDNLYLETAEVVQICIPTKRIGDEISKEYLIAFLNRPLKTPEIKGLVLMIHGLGGSSRRRGLRRMASSLIDSGFAVLRLNLRGADPGRQFAAGTYAANCNSDIFPAIEKAREICTKLQMSASSNQTTIPLYGVGISLGGTILLNARLEFNNFSLENNALDGLVCISSPLDLAECSAAIEKPRNTVYQTWLLQRLVRQTLEDPFGISESERENLMERNFWNLPKVSSIRAFDSFITAPRWGYKNVDEYYKNASPKNKLCVENFERLPKTLIVHSFDDPWVPIRAARELYESTRKKNVSNLDVLLTNKGGHNGFHGTAGCWGDLVVKNWLLKLAV